jgi:hypothetical protein
MIETSRRYLLQAANSPDDLATTLLERDWPICSAFLLDEYVLVHTGKLSDSSAAYGVVRLGEGWPLHVATIELTGHDERSLRAMLEQLLASDFDPDSPPLDGVLWLDSLDDHECPFCS